MDYSQKIFYTTHNDKIPVFKNFIKSCYEVGNNEFKIMHNDILYEFYVEKYNNILVVVEIDTCSNFKYVVLIFENKVIGYDIYERIIYGINNYIIPPYCKKNINNDQ